VQRRRGRRIARALSWVAVVTSGSVLASAGVGYALVQRYDGNINRITGVLGDDEAEAQVDNGPRTILIVGSDSRDVEGEAFQGKGDEAVTGQRSDVVMLAHLYGGSDAVELVSIPRDSWVEIPAHTDAESGEPVAATEGKINNAFFQGGPALLVSTVERLSGLSIDHYLQVDFDGFRAIIDELDGVDVCLSKPAREPKSGIDLPAGVSTVRGEQALAFVRQRQGLARGDIDRIERQQRLLAAMVRKVTSRGTLLNPLRLNGVLDIATSSLQVDEGLTFAELRELAFRMRTVGPDRVVFTTIPIETSNGVRRGQSVVLIDEAGAQQLFGRIDRDVAPGEDVPPAEAPQVPLTVAPERIRVQVFNGSDVPGKGTQAAADLEKLGFLVGEPSNRSEGAGQTVVRHGPDRVDSARTVAAAIPGAVVELDPALGGVVEVIAGSAYDGAQPVTVTGPVQAAPPVESTTAEADPCGV
jgi:LCP family protein required for cell wall assembly